MQGKLRFTQYVSRFTRAYDGALRAAEIPKSAAAESAGIHPSTLTRIMADEIAASVEHVEKLLLVLPDFSDRLHCLREFLYDQTPPDYRDATAISFGILAESKLEGRPDGLREALDQLEKTATDDADLRALLTNLANATGKPGRKSGAEQPPAKKRARELRSTTAFPSNPKTG